MHRADTESKKISCREAARETGFTEVPIWGTPVTLNVAGIKTIRAKTFDQRRNFEFISKDQVRHHRSAGGRDVRHGARPPWHGVLSVPF